MEASIPTANAPRGFWIRLLAIFLDGLALAVIGKLFDIVLGTSMVSSEGAGISVQFNGWAMLIPALYTILFWIWKGATPGKMLLGMKITKIDGSPIGTKEAILRYIGYFISAVVLFLGFLWVAWDSKKQGWHDKIAGTIVVENK